MFSYLFLLPDLNMLTWFDDAEAGVADPASDYQDPKKTDPTTEKKTVPTAEKNQIRIRPDECHHKVLSQDKMMNIFR